MTFYRRCKKCREWYEVPSVVGRPVTMCDACREGREALPQPVAAAKRAVSAWTPKDEFITKAQSEAHGLVPHTDRTYWRGSVGGIAAQGGARGGGKICAK